MSEDLLFAVADRIATITLNRPAVLNSYTEQMVEGWVAALEQCKRDPDIRVVVITGVGRGFCTGGDVSGFAERAAQTPAEVKARLANGPQRLPWLLFELDKPVIAALNGIATGGGLDIALACDIRLAAESAKLAETYTRMGLLACMGGAWFLPRIVGIAKALEMLWTSEWVEAREAAAIGLVSKVIPDTELMQETYVLARKLAAAAPLSVRLSKRVLRQGLQQDLATSLDYAASNLPVARLSADHKEAVSAYNDKRTPDFRGQ
jgi:enoyl-CoA hydratase/carnithine racemase